MSTERRRISVLIVDDQISLCESMAGVLELEGFEVHTFGSGAEAIAAVRERVFDIAFIDVRMPGMDGLDTFRGLRSLRPDLIVYMMTAYAEEGMVGRALAEGARGCMYKPFEMDQIIAVIDAAFAQVP